MGKRRFEIVLEATAVLEIDDAVIQAVDDEWYGQVHVPRNAEELAQHIVEGFHMVAYDPVGIATHIGYKMITDGAKLSDLDGWADQPDENARLSAIDWEIERVTECQ